MSLPPDYWINQIRADLATRKTTNCRHGVDRGRGTCTDCTHETETEETDHE